MIEPNLLVFEDMLVEVVLQVLVGVVDWKLLEEILRKVLESKDVEHAYRVALTTTTTTMQTQPQVTESI